MEARASLISTVSGDQLHVHDKTKLELAVCEDTGGRKCSHHLILAEISKRAGILGNNFKQKHDCLRCSHGHRSTDWRKKTQINHELIHVSIYLHGLTRETCKRGRVQRWFFLPPRFFSKAAVYTRESIGGLLLEGSNCFKKERGVGLPKCLI